MSSSSSTLPWYRDATGKHPFALSRKIHFSADVDFSSVAFFPWTFDSLSRLWNGEVKSSNWTETISRWSDAVAFGSRKALYVSWMRRKVKPICIRLPETVLAKADDPINVAWALSRDCEPLIVFSAGRLLFIFNAEERCIRGTLRGHGGAITSIAVDPSSPSVCCTTSRDFTTRIYDLTLEPQKRPNNPHWLPGKLPSLAGPAHGLDSSEPEGTGIGRCVAVLMGGRSGGHQAAVLGAAFNAYLPLVATCGVDRCVKIWRVPPLFPDTLAREDKPIFSSSHIHKARVLSVNWLSSEILITHGGSAMMRKTDKAEDKETYLENATIAVWRWLGMDRFFPPDQPADDAPQQVLRGCASDYQESSSFKLLSVTSLPLVANQYDVAKLQIYQSPTHDPLILLTSPGLNTIRLVNITHLPPCSSPSIRNDLASTRKKMRPQEEGDGLLEASVLPPIIQGRDIAVQSADSQSGRAVILRACGMGFDGSLIVGLGTQGIIWIFESISRVPS